MQKVKSLVPLSEIESGALDQLKVLDACEYVDEIAVMPDVHQGYYAPIGTAISSKDHICPEAIGFDIGCGVLTICSEEPLSAIKSMRTLASKNEVLDRMRKEICCGFSRNKEETSFYKAFPSCAKQSEYYPLFSKLKEAVDECSATSLGTLGGGNHFIEIGRVGHNPRLAVTVHSGSRHPGHLIAECFTNTGLFKDNSFPQWLSEGSERAGYYKLFHDWAILYAAYNRDSLMRKTFEILGATPYEPLQCTAAHNYLEKHPDRWIHRKGAVGGLGTAPIPGDRGSGVYLVNLIHNEEFLYSASHGAGRVMSRRKAKETLSMDEYKKSITGIVNRAKKSSLDEAPAAYKDIAKVLSYQEGITLEVMHHIKPLISFKDE